MKITDEDLVRFADHTLDSDRLERLKIAAKADDALAQKLAALEASRLPFTAAYAHSVEPALPDELKTKALQWIELSRVDPDRPVSPSWARGYRALAAAACLLVIFGAGFFVATVSTDSALESRLAMGDPGGGAKVAKEDDWVERVAVYQSLYVPNTVRQAKGGRSKAELLLEDIEGRTGMVTNIPDFSALGYRFVRAQELGYEGEPLVQLVYVKEGKDPLALCFMPESEPAIESPVLSSFHGLNTIYWQDGGQRFVIVASEPSSELQRLHQQVKSDWI